MILTSLTGSLFFLILLGLAQFCFFLIIMWICFRLLAWPIRRLVSSIRSLIDFNQDK